MLFEESRHEPLTQAPWEEQLVRQTILSIAADARDAFSEDDYWPIHPTDVSVERPATLKPIYYGAAGVIWSLNHLASAGIIPASETYARYLPGLLASHRRDSARIAGNEVVGYQIGDVGILLLQHQIAPSTAVANELRRVIERNTEEPAKGFVWGGAGLALAALFMYERTGEDHWQELFLSIVDVLWSSWEYDSNAGCYLWMTDLYGAKAKRMMALHGLPGIVFPMLRGIKHLPKPRADTLITRVVETIQRTAIRDSGLANWPLAIGETELPNADTPRVQHCIGAPGIINSLAAHLPKTTHIDELLLAAGELIWRAGPLAKMPSLCHGVPGNGFAFLKLYERTKEPLWLNRARHFAMHAIEQNRRFTKRYGVRKYSLWTGDLGLAIFLWRCLDGSSEIPTLDEF